jgi:O-antigen ligase
MSASDVPPPHDAPVARPMMRRPGLPSMGFGGLLIITYLVVTRLGGLRAAKLGFEFGPVPLYYTDITMALMLFYSLAARPAGTIMWLAGGGATGVAGRLVWLLAATSVVHAIAAFSAWGFLAIRDLAIFSYALFFPLTYLILDTPAKAARVVRIMAYAGFGLAAFFAFDVFSGLQFYFGAGERILTTERVAVASYAGGDEGGMCAFGLVAMLAFLLTERENRLWYLLMMFVCALGVALPQTRAAAFGIALAMMAAFLLANAATRLSAIIGGTVILGLGLLFVTFLPETGLARTIGAFYTALVSGASVTGDDNAYFRLLRWNAAIDLWLRSPFVGMGFGRPIIPEFLIQQSERGLNAGLPHNSFLTVIARMGIVGIALVVLPWMWSIAKAIRGMRSPLYRPEAFAAALVLICMLGYANFVLFLERPMHAAALWITAACACRLGNAVRR